MLRVVQLFDLLGFYEVFQTLVIFLEHYVAISSVDV